MLAAVMCLGLAACGGSGSDVNTIEKDSSKAEASSAEAAPSETAQAPAEAAVGTGYIYTLTYKDASIDVLDVLSRCCVRDFARLKEEYEELIR